MKTIYLNPELESRGYSGGCVYEDDDICMSLCQTNEGGKPTLPVFRIDFDKLDLCFIAGEQDYCVVQDLLQRHMSGLNTWRNSEPWKEAAKAFAWKFLFRNLTPELIKHTVAHVHKTSFNEGREAKRQEFLAVLSRF